LFPFQHAALQEARVPRNKVVRQLELAPQRDAQGRVLPGARLNPFGRPAGSLNPTTKRALRRAKAGMDGYVEEVEKIARDPDSRIALPALRTLIELGLRPGEKDDAPPLKREALTPREQQTVQRIFARAARRQQRGKLPGAVIDITPTKEKQS
jgi:hypothetical protein